MQRLLKSFSKPKIHIDTEPEKEKEKEPVQELSETTLANFRCPISMEIMVEPVITKEGYSYERANILNWLNTHTTCPLSRGPLSERELLSNRSLKATIDHYRKIGLLPAAPDKPQSRVQVGEGGGSQIIQRVLTDVPQWTTVSNPMSHDNNPIMSRHEIIITLPRRTNNNIIILPQSNNNLRPQPTFQGHYDTSVLPPLDIPDNPDFDFITDESNRRMFQSAYQIITYMNSWDFIRRYSPSQDSGYGFDRTPAMVEILAAVERHYDCHSGASLAYTMRFMQYIAKNGFEKFKEMYMQLP